MCTAGECSGKTEGEESHAAAHETTVQQSKGKEEGTGEIGKDVPVLLCVLVRCVGCRWLWHGLRVLLLSLLLPPPPPHTHTPTHTPTPISR
jgi:hypothetical protein